MSAQENLVAVNQLYRYMYFTNEISVLLFGIPVLVYSRASSQIYPVKLFNIT